VFSYDNSTAQYTYGPQGLVSERKSGTSYYTGNDHLGTVWNVVTLDSNETVVSTYTYTAFGNTAANDSIGNPFRYVGAQGYYDDYSDSGLMLLGARYYDPSMGKFMTLDPIKYGANWFAYADGNAVLGHRSEMTEAGKRHTRVWEMLEERREALSFQEIIMGEARGQAVGALQEELASVQQKIVDIECQINSLKEQLAEYEDKNRRSFLKDSFNEMLRNYSVQLNVPVIGPLRSFASKINQTGSDLPRAVLAYSFAILQMILSADQSVFAPIVIDSPNQQDQDQPNLKTMLTFIRRNRTPDSQLILALVDPQGVDFGGTEIELTEKRHVLDEDLYDSVGSELEDLLLRMSTQ